MEEKMLPVPNEGHRRRQKQRRRRFPWGSIATVILVVAVCVYAFTLFGDKESPENSQVNDTATQGPDDVQVGLLDESSPQNTQTANDDTDWNLVLVNYENAIDRPEPSWLLSASSHYLRINHLLLLFQGTCSPLLLSACTCSIPDG